jgi:hypothetical protein
MATFGAYDIGQDNLRLFGQHFDATGDVIWQQSGRATVSGLILSDLSESNALLVKTFFAGRIQFRPRKDSYNWRASGKDAQVFAEAILPYTVKLRDLLSFFIEARKQTIFSAGVGRGSDIDAGQLEFRRGIAEAVQSLRKEAGLPRGNQGVQ